jgi:putative two-component system response regulator
MTGGGSTGMENHDISHFSVDAYVIAVPASPNALGGDHTAGKASPFANDAKGSVTEASSKTLNADEQATNDHRVIPAEISHEIKTRLNAIIGFSEILQGCVDEPALKHYLSIIRTSGDKLLSLVDNDFDMGRMQSNSQSLALCVKRSGENDEAAPDVLCVKQSSENNNAAPDALLVKRYGDNDEAVPNRLKEFGSDAARHACDEPAIHTPLRAARQAWEDLIGHGRIDTVRDVVFTVDDNEDNLAMIAHMFAAEHIPMFPFTSAYDVLEAVQLVTPSLILLDVIMPELDGYEVCRRLKENEQTKTIPIIYLTGKTEPNDIVRGFQSGGVDYIAKPFRKEELLSRVKTHLALHQTEQSLKEALNEKQQLLDETLKGSIKVLIDILAMTNPETFAQTLRVRNIARKMAVRLGLANAWEIEIGILLSRLGCAVIPSEIVQKKQNGKRLTSREHTVYNSHPKAAARFISNIPRLGQVAESIQNQFAEYNPKNGPDIIKDFIQIVFEYDNRIQFGNTQQQALDEMNEKPDRYNPLVFGALEAEVRKLMDGYVVRTIPFEELKTGMILADDIRNASNIILVRRNSELSDVLLEKLKNLRYCGRTYEPIKILEHLN